MNLINILAVDMCDKETGLLPIFTTIGNIVTFIKIAVPIIIIILGSIDLMKAVMASKDDEIKKAQGILIKRVIYGVVIFFIPTIISMVLGLVGQEKSPCLRCVVDPNHQNCVDITEANENW